MIILQILVIALLFTLVVGAHEFGHYLFARWRGMDVEEFAIGFGPRMASRTDKHGTVWALRAFPLGGFIRTKGMEPKEDGSEVTVPNGFYSKGLISRALVLIGGPLFSFLFGWLLFFGNAAAYGWENSPYVGTVQPDSPASVAGIQTGDRLVSVNGKEIGYFAQFGEEVQEADGKPLNVVVERDGSPIPLTVTAEFKASEIPQDVLASDEYKEDTEAYKKAFAEKRWLVGVMGERTRPVGLVGAVSVANMNTWRVVSETAKIFAKPERLSKEVGGVIMIGQAAGEAVNQGLSYFIILSALISVSLGIINLIPIPLLDGGQLLVVGIEALRGGRRLSLKTQEALGFVGILIIAALFLTVTYLDVGRLING
ncbi:MAG: RIP metalloprotease [Fimbriimonadales bacterium]